MKKFANPIEKYLSILVVSLAILTLIICFFSPIYTDEILWKVIQGRYRADGNQALAQSMLPSCGSYSYTVPMLLLPYRLLNNLVDNALLSPLLIRLWGITIAIVWLFTTWLLFRNLVSKYIKSITVGLCVISFATLGIMPFLLTLSRPEQLLLLCITLFFVPLLKESSEHPCTLRQSCFNALGIFLLASFMLTIHPKALFVMPLVFVSISRFINSRWLAVFCMIAISSFAAIAYHDWSIRWSCPKDPIIANALHYNNVGSITHLTDFKPYFLGLLKSLSYSNSWYISFAVPEKRYVSNMIPPFTNTIFLKFGQTLHFILAFVFITAFFIFIINLFKNWRNIKLRASYLAIGTIWLFYAISIMTRIIKNAYEATLIVPLLALATAGTLWLIKPTTENQNFNRDTRFFFIGLLLLSVLSQIALITTYLPYVITSWSKPGYIATQRFSISNFSYNKLRPRIVKAAAKCGIRASDHPHHLVVDELTYFAFIDSYQPFFMTYLDEKGWCRHIADPTQLLTRYQSAGMIVGCHWIPKALRKKAIQDGPLCCLPAFS